MSQSVALEMELSHEGLDLIFLVILIWHSSSLSFANGGGTSARRWVKQLELVVLPVMISERLNAPPLGFRQEMRFASSPVALTMIHSTIHW